MNQFTKIIFFSQLVHFYSELL